jgi:hypothetical protein
MPPLSPENILLDFEDSFNSLTTLEDAIDETPHKSLHEQNERGPARSTVCFSEQDIVVDTLHVKAMSEEEKEASWFSYEEIRYFKKDCLGLVGMLDDGMADMLLAEDENDLCLRGLEQYSREEKHLRINARRQIYREIFEIQEFSHFQGISRTELIAQASSKWSASLREEAMKLGQADALSVQLC